MEQLHHTDAIVLLWFKSFSDHIKARNTIRSVSCFNGKIQNKIPLFPPLCHSLAKLSLTTAAGIIPGVSLTPVNILLNKWVKIWSHDGEVKAGFSSDDIKPSISSLGSAETSCEHNTDISSRTQSSIICSAAGRLQLHGEPFTTATYKIFLFFVLF